MPARAIIECLRLSLCRVSRSYRQQQRPLYRRVSWDRTVVLSGERLLAQSWLLSCVSEAADSSALLLSRTLSASRILLLAGVHALPEQVPYVVPFQVSSGPSYNRVSTCGLYDEQASDPSFSVTAVRDNPFSRMGCTAESNFELISRLQLSLSMTSGNLVELRVTRGNGQVQHFGPGCAGNCTTSEFVFEQDEYITSMVLCQSNVPECFFNSAGEAFDSFSFNTSLNNTFSSDGPSGCAASLFPPTIPCTCSAIEVGSCLFCGVYGYGPDKKQRILPANARLPSYWAAINAIGFAFLKVPQSASIGNMTYPTLAQQELALVPLAVSSGSYDNDTPLEQEYSEEHTVSKYVKRSWSTSNSMQRTLGTKSTKTDSCE